MGASVFLRTLALILMALFGQIIPGQTGQTAPEIIGSWMDSANLSKMVSVSNQGISHDEASGITTITNLKILISISASAPDNKGTQDDAGKTVQSNARYQFIFPQIRFTNLLEEGGYYLADKITADVVNFELDITRKDAVAKSKGQYDRLEIVQAKWSKLPKTTPNDQKPASQYYKLAAALFDYSFAGAKLGKVSMEQVMDGGASRMNFSYGAMTMGKTVRGNTQSIELGGMEMVIHDRKHGDEPVVTISARKVSAKDNNLGNIIALFNPVNSAGNNGQYVNMFGELKYELIKAVVNDGATPVTISIKSFLVEDLGIRKTDISLLDMLDKLIVLAKAQKDPNQDLIAEIISTTYGAMKIGRFDMTGFLLVGPDQITGKVDKFVIENLSGDGMEHFYFDGYDGRAEDGVAVKIGHFGIKDIKFPTIKALLKLEQATDSNDIAAILKAIPIIGEISMRDLFFTAAGKQDENASLKDMTLTMKNHIGPIPTDVHYGIKGLSFPVSMMENEGKQWLVDAGYSTVNVDYSISLAWTETSKILRAIIGAKMKDGGQFDFNADFGGVPRSIFENPMEIQAVAPLVTFKKATASYLDKSLIDRVIKAIAKQQNDDPEVLKQRAIGYVPFALEALENQEFIKPATRAIQRIIESGGEISLFAEPTEAISVFGLVITASQAPGAMVETLRLRVESQ